MGAAASSLPDVLWEWAAGQRRGLRTVAAKSSKQTKRPGTASLTGFPSAASPGATTGERRWEPAVSVLGRLQPLISKGTNVTGLLVASGRACFSWAGSAWSTGRACLLSKEVAQASWLLGFFFLTQNRKKASCWLFYCIFFSSADA